MRLSIRSKHAQIVDFTTLLARLPGDGIAGAPSHAHRIALAALNTLQLNGLLNAIDLVGGKIAARLRLEV